MVLPDGRRRRHQLRARRRGAAFKTIDGPYELHPDVTMMTSWHLPENPLQKSGHGSLLQTHTGEWYMAYLTSRPLRLPGVPLLASGGRGYCPLGARPASPALNGATAGRTWKAASTRS
jgi:beta-xylosidase